MSRHKILDLDKISYEELEGIITGIEDEQAENSDVGGDSDPEDLLPLNRVASSKNLRNLQVSPAPPLSSPSTSVQPSTASSSFSVPSPSTSDYRGRGCRTIRRKPMCRVRSGSSTGRSRSTTGREEDEDLHFNPDVPINASPIPISPQSTSPSLVRGVRTRGSGARTRGPGVQIRGIRGKRGRGRSSTYVESPYKFRKIFRMPTEFKNFSFRSFNGINVEVNLSSPLQIFMLFFTQEILEHIVLQSNLYSKNQLSLEIDELRTFFGMLIIMGFHALPSIRHYWSTDNNFSCSRISGLMTLKRFLKILRYLHLNDNSTMKPRGDPEYDRLYKVRPLLVMVSENFKKVFSPHRFLSVDESMIPFKGRSMLKQYMPLKPTKRGFKVWVLCCAVTGYMYCMEVYEGKNQDSASTGLGEEVVMKLTHTFAGLGFCIYFDRFFNSLCLLTKLLAKKIFACGTLLATRKYFPKERLCDDNDLGTGDFDSVMDGSISITKWKDRGRKCVLMASNMHNPAAITSVMRTNREGRKEEVKCPKAIADYNTYMGGVDRFDQLMSSYTVSWKSRRWWMKIFYYLLDCAIVNSYIVYREVAKDVLPHSKILSHLSFRSKLADELIADFTSRKLLSKTKRPKFVADQPHFPKKTSCNRCAYCSTKAKVCRSRIGCDVCDVSLCLECFKDYHLNNCRKKNTT